MEDHRGIGLCRKGLTKDCTASMGIAFRTPMIVPAPNVFTREDTWRGSVRYPGLSMGLEPGYGRRNRFDRVGRRKRIESDRDSTAANDRACLTLSESAPPP